MSPPDGAPAVPALETRGLCVSYGGRTVLRDVTLAVPAGGLTAVVGPSGCGKSSFLLALNRLTDLVPGCRVEGSIRLFGQEVLGNGTAAGALRRRVGKLFQRPNPFPLSVRENLLLPLREHGLLGDGGGEDRVEELLRSVGLWEEVKERLDAPAPSLSGGQQQRLCLARALSLSPEVLLMDEPCSALDPLASAAVEALIRDLRGRYTVVLVTHNLAQARRLADTCALFWVRDGAGWLVEHAPAEEFFNAPKHPCTRAYVEGHTG